jgi:hypothetical protein
MTMNFFQFADDLKNYSTEKFLDELQIDLESSEYTKALQKQQWNEGIGSDGNILGRYSKTTEILSDGRKKAGETYDIFETGETRRKLILFSTQQDKDLSFFFDSDSQAVPDLLQLIGPRLFGLAGKSKEQFTAIAVEKAIQLLNTNLKLK